MHESNKKKSNSESAASREAGTAKGAAASKRGADGRERAGAAKRAGEVVEVELVHARMNYAAWALATLVVGGLLLWKFAVLGKIVGALFLFASALSARSFARTFLYEPGTIRVESDRLVLPEGLCRGRTVELSWPEVKHAFLLRRAVSFTQAGPVIVVENADSAWTYPRDWFASDSDQRRVLDAIHKRLGSG